MTVVTFSDRQVRRRTWCIERLDCVWKDVQDLLTMALHAWVEDHPGKDPTDDCILIRIEDGLLTASYEVPA